MGVFCAYISDYLRVSDKGREKGVKFVLVLDLFDLTTPKTSIISKTEWMHTYL